VFDTSSSSGPCVTCWFLDFCISSWGLKFIFVFTREELLRSVWGLGSYARTRTLDSHAARLRARLRIGGERFVRNVWGVGYCLIDGTHCV
jgi:hypothetical protein